MISTGVRAKGKLPEEESADFDNSEDDKMCQKHSFKIAELINKLQDLHLNDVELKIRNDQLIRLISQQAEDDHEANEQSKLWKHKYNQLKEENQKKNIQILRLVQSNQIQNRSEELTNIKKQKQSRQQKATTVKNNNCDELTWQQTQYVHNLNRQSSERKIRNNSRKTRNMSNPASVIIRIQDNRWKNDNSILKVVDHRNFHKTLAY